MIAFASLFIGLILGIHPVTLLVGDSIAYVEVVLNDQSVDYLRSEPWSLNLDFGPELRPHRLVAIGYGADRREVARVQQWVNLPRQPAETALVVESGDDGRGATVRLSWNSVVGEQPKSVAVTFDGHPLEVTDPLSIDLPDHDPEVLHFIRAELDFSDTVSSLQEITFGGAFADQTNFELTAVPYLLDDGVKHLIPQGLRGVSRRNIQPLSVVAVEKGPAEILIVLDEGAKEALRQVGRINSQDLKNLIQQEAARKEQAGVGRVNLQDPERNFRIVTGRDIARRSLRKRMQLSADMRLRFLWPFAEQQVRVTSKMDIFPPSREFTGEDGGFYWVLMQARPTTQTAGPQRLADAVAAGSVLVARRKRRRAIVLILGEQPQDASDLTPSQVQRFLTTLRVPLFVWSTGSSEDLFAREWRSVTEISSLSELDRAVKQMYQQLERQRIVWIGGLHLPQDIELSSADPVFSLAP